MHELILWVRHLRNVGAFKVSARLLLVLLMVMGLWVATSTPADISLPTINDKIQHLLVFFTFAMLADLVTVRKPFWLWKGLPLMGYGALIEVMQFYTPHRSFELADWVADFCGVFLYYTIKYTLCKLDGKKDRILIK